MKFDVVIIGGGLAGSAAAISLRRSGKRVLLLEKETTAHHKVCGEFISCEAMHYLSALGINLDALGAELINHVRLVRGKKSASSKLPFQAHSLSRKILDEALLELAKAEGVEILRGVTVIGLHQEGPDWRVSWADNEVRAHTIFLATGKHDVRGWQRPHGLQNDMIGFKIHYQLKSDQATALSRHVEIILFKGGYAGLEPVENGIINLCLVVKKSCFNASGKNWDSFIKDLLLKTPHLADRLEGSTTSWARPLAIYGIPYGFVFKGKAQDQAGLYRIGDQMAVIPSFSGDGMAIALHTAALAVSAYLKEDCYKYHINTRRELIPQIRRATWLSLLMSPAWMQGMLIAICRLMPGILPLIVKATRINQRRYSMARPKARKIWSLSKASQSSVRR